jgi:hypothetical protein
MFAHRNHGLRKKPGLPLPLSDSRLSVCDVSSDHVQVVGSGFERLLGIMVRN